MVFTIVLLLFTCANAQFLLPFNAVVSHYKGYTFDLHPDSHLLTVRNINRCFFIHTTETLVKAFTDTSTRSSIQEEIFGYIENNIHVTHTSLVQTTIDFRDGAATSGCLGRDLFKLVYPAAKTNPTSQSSTTESNSI